MKRVYRDKEILQMNLKDFDFIYKGDVRKFGNSGHIPAPKRFIGREVYILIKGKKGL